MFQCLECPYNTENKYNFNRHITKKHSKIINNVINTLPNVIHSLPNVIHSLPNVITSNPNVIHNNQCNKCHKILSSKGTLTRHMKTCSGLNNKQCIFCNKILSSIQYKEKHQLICKDKNKPATIINNTNNIDNSITNIQNNDNSTNIQNNDNSTNIQNNTQNIDNSVNIVVFNSNPNQTTKFDTHHITPDVLIQIFKQSMNNNTKLCSNLLDAIWEQVNNRCIIKKNIKTHISKISGENGSWLSGLDLDIYPKYLKDAYKTSKRLISKYKPELYKTLTEKKVDETYHNMDTFQSLEMDDKPLTDEYMIEDNFSRGYSKEECAYMRNEQKLDNILIEEYQRNYKRYICKASDNAKRLA